jgi:hypothetical protein
MALNLRAKPAAFLIESPHGAAPVLKTDLTEHERAIFTEAGCTIHRLVKEVAPRDAWKFAIDEQPLHDGGPRRKGVLVWAVYHSHFSRVLHTGVMEYHRLWGWRPEDAEHWDWQCLMWQALPTIPMALKLKNAQEIGRAKKAKHAPITLPDQML